MNARILVATSALILISLQAWAETLGKKSLRATERLIPLEKITVGPDDQYNADVDPTGSTIVFTHKADLVASLRLQDLASGETLALLPPVADSQGAVFSPDGRAAFSYYKLNARGDICHVQPPRAPLKQTSGRSLEESEIRCLKRSSAASTHQRSNPFWRSSHEIGFLERGIANQETRIVSEDVASGKQEVLAEGRLWSPSMRAGGRYLAYMELESETSGRSLRRIVLKDLQSGEKRLARFALPGLSGFPTIGADERHLYFSHFLNDTNGDQAIDGSDNAVVFRVSIPALLAAARMDKEILPEQLTSVETSCSFPRPFRDRIYVTCAFEGSLDVYSIPESGVVPAAWNEARLQNALDTSRSYQDRILILNTLKYRFPNSTLNFDERLLSDHILAEDVSAARFYLARISAGAKPVDAGFLKVLEAYLQGSELKKAEPPGEISREFRKAILALEERVRAAKADERARELVRGHLRLFLDEPKTAEAHLKKAQGKGAMRALERHLDFELARAIYQPRGRAAFGELAEAYRRILLAPELGNQALVYYAFGFLRATHANFADRASRRSWIENLLKSSLSSQVKALLGSELATYAMIEADEKSLSARHREFDKFMSETRGDYFLRRAIYVRAIVNFTEAGQIKHLGMITRNWMGYTTNADTEFVYAREVFTDSSVTQAYANAAKGEHKLADNYFFESLMFTDDLESHYGFILARVAQGRRATLNPDYKDLAQRGFIDDNMKFVEAVLDLIDGAESARANPLEVAPFESAIAKLESMTLDRDSAMRHLVLGYCYLEKLMRKANGYDFDAAVLQSAHRSLMLAYDLGRDNPRIRASALMNLGILHLRVQNPGQAARYFAFRKALGFESEAEKARFAYLYARALEFSRQPDEAAAELKDVVESARSVPGEERRAFNLAFSSKYSEAATIYQGLLSARKIEGDENLAKANLVFGFALLKIKRDGEARLALLRALEHASRLSREKRSADRMIDFDPLRLRLVAQGLLAQVGGVDERASAAAARVELLESAQDLMGDWAMARVQARAQVAELESKRGRHEAAARSLQDALRLAIEYGDTEQYLGQITYRTAVNYLAHAILHREVYAKLETKAIAKLVSKCREAFEAQKVSEPVLDAQSLRLQILWNSFMRQNSDVMNSETAKRLRVAEPKLYAEVARLAAAI